MFGAVDELLASSEAELVRYDRLDLVERLQAERTRLTHPVCTTLVIGEFNKGKSSMINAMLNARICATDADVATAVPTIVRYAEALSASAHATEGCEPTPLSPTDVEALVTRRASERKAGTERAGRPAAAAIEIGIPRELLRDGLVLVDTPGMGGGLNSAHAAATLRALAGADAVVFVTDASQELSAAEVDLLKRASEVCRHLAVAVTKIDFYPEWRRILELNLQHLHRAELPVPLYPISAPVRHNAVRLGDRALYAESGFPVLAGFLRWAQSGIRLTAAAGAATTAHGALLQLISQATTAHEAAADPGGRVQRMAELNAAKVRADQLRSTGSRWQLALSDRIGDMSSAVDFDITTRMRATRREVAEKLADTDPKGWLELEPWLYERTNTALAEHLRVIRQQADEVADHVSARFGETAWEVRVHADASQMGLRGTVAGEQSGLAVAATGRKSNVEAMMGMARGGSVAVVATHAVGIVFALALPVTIPIAAVLAGVLGRVTWRSARKVQVRQLRAEVERTVGVYLDEVEIRARRDSRDAVRRVQQHLREVFTEHATQLHTSTARNLEVLTQSLRADLHTDQESLARSAAELERLEALAARAGALADQLLDASNGHGGG